MRYVLYGCVFSLIIMGCKQNSDIISPTITPTLSNSNVKDSILYTFTISKATYGIQDTLIAWITLYNQSMSTDTVILLKDSPLSLINDTGKTIFGLCEWCCSDTKASGFSVILGPYQSFSKFITHYPLSYYFAASIVPGAYVLQETLNEQNFSMSFNINISLQ
jgi:hypothetical protein